MTDLINRPPHYTTHPSGVEAIDLCEHMTFCPGNVLKYLWRHSLKGGVDDLRKAEWYLMRASRLFHLEGKEAEIATRVAAVDAGLLGDVLRLMLDQRALSKQRMIDALVLIRHAISFTPSRDERAHAETLPPPAGDEEIALAEVVR
jgi:hypothetical protein